MEHFSSNYLKISVFGLLIISILFSNCKSVDKLYDQQKYEEVMNRLKSKAKKKGLDRSEWSMLLNASNNYLRESNDYVRRRIDSKDYSDWHDAKNRLDETTENVADIIKVKDSFREKLDINQFLGLEQQLNQKLMDHYYDKYLEEEAKYFERYDRKHLIKAYSIADELLDFNADPLMVDSLQSFCIEEGHRSIFVETNCDAFDNHLCYSRFVNRINLVDNEWNSFVNRYNDADYHLIIGAEILNKSQNIFESIRTYNEDVVTGYETETDSTGTKQKEIYTQVSAQVNEIKYERIVVGRAYYDLIDVRSGRNISGNNFTHTEQNDYYENIFVSGDQRAIPAGLILVCGRNDYYDFGTETEDVFQGLARSFYYSIP